MSDLNSCLRGMDRDTVETVIDRFLGEEGGPGTTNEEMNSMLSPKTVDEHYAVLRTLAVGAVDRKVDLLLAEVGKSAFKSGDDSRKLLARAAANVVVDTLVYYAQTDSLNRAFEGR